jgi:MFS family permease
MRLRGRILPRLARRNAAFRSFWAGQAVSLVGDQVTLIALPLTAIFTLHAGPAQMGLLTAAALAPNLLFSVHLGAWVDRHAEPRRPMIAADLARALLLATVPVAAALGALSLPQLFAVAFCVGSLEVLFVVATNSMFVSLVPRRNYVEASTLLNGNRALAGVAGPSLGGLLVQAVSAPFALLVDCVSFLGSAGFIRRTPRPAPPRDHRGDSGEITAGLRYVMRSPAVRATLGACATVNFFNFVFFAIFLLYATRTLGIAPGLLGLILGAGALGGVAAMAVIGRIVRRFGPGPTFIAGTFAFTAPLVLVPLAAGPKPVVVALLFLAELGSSFGVMLLDVPSAAIIAAIVPDALRARVSGAYMLVNFGTRPLGALAGGLLGATLGLRPTLWIATLGGVLGVLWLLPSPIRRMRSLPDEDARVPPRRAASHERRPAAGVASA